MADDPSDISRSQIDSKPRRSVTISLKPIIAVIILIVLCGLSFWGGEKYQKSHTPTSTTTTSSSSQGAAGGFGGRSGFGNRGGGFGQVTAVSATSITITNQRTGAATTYSISSSTTVTDNGSTTTVSDIQTGDTVLVRTSGSGSTVATSIDVNPSFSGGAGADPTTQ